jgi:hypothetical protein
MQSFDALAAHQFINAVVAAFSMLGGAMASVSGSWAAQAILEDQPPNVVSQRVNEGIGMGFVYGAPLALVALIIAVWT